MDKEALKKFALDCGADLVGVADLDILRGIETQPADLFEGFTNAISIAIRLADGVIDAIKYAPTPLYQQHYGKVNALLDDVALRVCQYVQRARGNALPIPASQLLNKTTWSSYVSHKAIALAAGLGWQGKSLLLVTHDFGPRVRLVSVLTDLPLEPDRPVKNRCGKCTSCTEACPAQAIKNVSTEYHYSSRDEALYFDRCAKRVSTVFAKMPFIESPICGVCIRACPWGQKAGRKRVTAEEDRKSRKA